MLSKTEKDWDQMLILLRVYWVIAENILSKAEILLSISWAFIALENNGFRSKFLVLVEGQYELPQNGI